jgi:hypothetical protein
MYNYLIMFVVVLLYSSMVTCQTHVFVSAFYDLNGFRAGADKYMDSLSQILAGINNLILFCNAKICMTIKKNDAFNPKHHTLIEVTLNSTNVATYETQIFDAQKHMAELYATSGKSQAHADIFLGGNDPQRMTKYLMINHVKIEFLVDVATKYSSNTEIITWIDAGIYRHAGVVKGFDPKSIGCYNTSTCRLSTSVNSNSAWPSKRVSIFLDGDRREVAAGVMTFNTKFLINEFSPRYFDMLKRLLKQRYITTEQGLLSLLVQEMPEVDHIAVGYADIARYMLNCNVNNVAHREGNTNLDNVAF